MRAVLLVSTDGLNCKHLCSAAVEHITLFIYWHEEGWFPRSLLKDQCATQSYHDFVVRGSDHRSFRIYMPWSFLVQSLMEVKIKWFLGQQLQFLSFKVSGFLV